MRVEIGQRWTFQLHGILGFNLALEWRERKCKLERWPFYVFSIKCVQELIEERGPGYHGVGREKVSNRTAGL